MKVWDKENGQGASYCVSKYIKPFIQNKVAGDKGFCATSVNWFGVVRIEINIVIGPIYAYCPNINTHCFLLVILYIHVQHLYRVNWSISYI